MKYGKHKIFMSWHGKRIWYTKSEDGDVVYMVAKGDGTDEYFSDWKDAAAWIDKRS